MTGDRVFAAAALPQARDARARPVYRCNARDVGKQPEAQTLEMGKAQRSKAPRDVADRICSRRIAILIGIGNRAHAAGIDHYRDHSLHEPRFGLLQGAPSLGEEAWRPCDDTRSWRR